MPRKRRIKSSLNCYHIVVRGINKEDIFFDENDKRKFLKELISTKEKYQYHLLAYVLMPNHIHMLLQEQEASNSEIMRSLLVRYATYFNKKYDRNGYVYQDRFYSKPAEDSEYIKNVIRYIHLNPEKAGITNYENYEWSSYQSLLEEKEGLISVERVKRIFLEEEKNVLIKQEKTISTQQEKKSFMQGISNEMDFQQLFTAFHKEKSCKESDEEYLEYEIEKRLEDEELYSILKGILGEQKLHDMPLYQKEYREKALMEIFKIKGTNCVQISRVTGINRKLIVNCREKYLRIEKKKREKEDN